MTPEDSAHDASILNQKDDTGDIPSCNDDVNLDYGDVLTTLKISSKSGSSISIDQEVAGESVECPKECCSAVSISGATFSSRNGHDGGVDTAASEGIPDESEVGRPCSESCSVNSSRRCYKERLSALSARCHKKNRTPRGGASICENGDCGASILMIKQHPSPPPRADMTELSIESMVSTESSQEGSCTSLMDKMNKKSKRSAADTIADDSRNLTSLIQEFTTIQSVAPWSFHSFVPRELQQMHSESDFDEQQHSKQQDITLSTEQDGDNTIEDTTIDAPAVSVIERHSADLGIPEEVVGPAKLIVAEKAYTIVSQSISNLKKINEVSAKSRCEGAAVTAIVSPSCDVLETSRHPVTATIRAIEGDFESVALLCKVERPIGESSDTPSVGDLVGFVKSLNVVIPKTDQV